MAHMTKMDKIKPSELEAVFAATSLEIKKRAAAIPTLHATSSEKFTGFDELRAEIAQIVLQG